MTSAAVRPIPSGDLSARCPVCHRRQRVFTYKWGFRFVSHLTAGRTCRGSEQEVYTDG